MVTRLCVILILLASCRFDLPITVAYDAEVDAAIDSQVDSHVDGNPSSWLHPWLRRKQITLLASQIEAPGGGALADFPALVSITDPQIAASALTTGQDIVFTAADGTTVLASEIELFTPATGQLVAWVKVPSLSATTNTVLYVYYGHQSPPQQQPKAVWTANYLAVWHLNQDPGTGVNGDIQDSTIAGRNGTTSAAFTSSDSVMAQIGRGLHFDFPRFLRFPQTNFSNAFTISMWVDFAGGSEVKTLFANSGSGLDTNGFRFGINSAGTADRKIIFDAGNGNTGSGRIAATAAAAIQINMPTHLAVVVNRIAGTATIYVNGMNAAIGASFPNDFLIDSEFNIGRAENNIYHFSGTLDEVQLASTLRSPEWLQTSFKNQFQPGNFHTLGAEERR